MKSVIKLLDMLHGIGLDYILTVGWYGYVGRLIVKSNQSLIVSILMLLGCLIFGFFTCLSIYNSFSEDDGEGD